ncbi:MAG: PrsW family intramembrane metalloprotease [Eubacterium sp.]|nr:PrsW family intramembrane metalloprotease [Eubacterium sp.]
MSYIENIFICLAAPLLLAIPCLRREGRGSLIFVVTGMTSCLFSAYVSTFLAGVMGANLITASNEISPAVEEIMKLLPILFLLLVFEPDRKIVINGALMVAVGFATFENVCFLTSYGTSDLLHILIRGFGTGAMHVVCGLVIAVSLFHLWDKEWLQIMGGFALLCFVITFHALFNILVNQTGIVFWIGSLIPLTVMLLYWFILRKIIGIK